MGIYLFSGDIMNKRLFEFIENSPSPYHVVRNIEQRLLSLGFCPLCEGDSWEIERGKGYFVTRNNSSIIAFRVPKEDYQGFMVCATHSDSPAITLKEKPELEDKHYVRLSTEKYGGMINSTWMDRPLSLAGRVVVNTPKGVSTILVDTKEPVAIIPNTPIHLNRKLNEGITLNPAVDMLPLYGICSEDRVPLTDRIADMAGVSREDILSTDLLLYNADKGAVIGDFISAPRIDDLQCVYACLEAFEQAEAVTSIPVLAVFDNEEIGSKTPQGADSDFLHRVLRRVADATGCDCFDRKAACSFLLSCDNAHALHPNHPELFDANHQVLPNGGVVIKHNSNRQYTTDGISCALVTQLCRKAQVPCQHYYNRADIPGGSTLGCIAGTQLSMLSADVGLAQFAMHSALETAGRKDTEYMMGALKAFFESSLKVLHDGEYELS
ncbi:MAG: M18 family aminopeptidase [Ruminococcus sp.]|nr:M18 family aminopeptidase [Ruminococcus sp.]